MYTELQTTYRIQSSTCNNIKSTENIVQQHNTIHFLRGYKVKRNSTVFTYIFFQVQTALINQYSAVVRNSDLSVC